MFPILCYGQYSQYDVYVMDGSSHNEYDYNSNSNFEDEIVYLKLTDEPVTGSITSYTMDKSKKVTPFLNGLRHGQKQSYYQDNKTLFSTINYIKGSGEGWLKSYHKNGKLAQKVFYISGCKDGNEEFYDSFGMFSRVNVWSNCRRVRK